MAKEQHLENENENETGVPAPYAPYRPSGPYTRLTEPHLSSELARLSFATKLGDTDCVTFQPCPNPDERSQDRYVVKDLHAPTGTWAFRAVFDGHAGHECADHISRTLPFALEQSLSTVDELSSPAVVERLLQSTIAAIDDQMAADLVALFPDQDALEMLSDEDVKRVINDSGENSAKVLKCMRGSTVLVSLLDPARKNLWVASLGDCQAVLGTRQDSGPWTSKLLSSNHNGSNPEEADRVRHEHPGEPECILYDRVLGALAVTKAVGDHEFKLPKIYTDRVFLNSEPGFILHSKVREFMRHSLTPPYVSNIADVQHVALADEISDAYLILCTDGLMDLYCAPGQHPDLSKLSVAWVHQLNLAISDGVPNRALHLLRDALGGSDEKRVSRMITVEMENRWMDDTTILNWAIRQM